MTTALPSKKKPDVLERTYNFVGVDSR